MYIKLKNDFGVDRLTDKTTVSDSKLTENWLNYIIQRGYASGLTQDKRRLYNTINQKIESAVKKGEDYFELNVVEYEFIKKAFEAAIVDPKFSLSVTVVEGAFMGAVEELPTDTYIKPKE